MNDTSKRLGHLDTDLLRYLDSQNIYSPGYKPSSTFVGYNLPTLRPRFLLKNTIQININRLHSPEICTTKITIMASS